MASRFHLTIQETNGDKSRVNVTLGTYAFGRDQGCQVVLRSIDVSRRHARVTFGESSFVVEDLGSASGTTVNGEPVAAATRFEYPQTVHFGGVAVQIKVAEPASPKLKPAKGGARDDDGVHIALAMDATERGQLPDVGLTGQVAARLAKLCELPLQLAAETDLDALQRLILQSAMELVPGSKRGALFLIEPDTGKLALRVSEPEEFPPISRSLIQRAAIDQIGFIWGDEDSEADAHHKVNLHLSTGMYAPLLWKEETLGVLCVDNPRHRALFQEVDLQFLVSAANYAAAALGSR
ncbi:MAG: Stage sporulation family protein [Verrucomicrobiaceae bacterium]|nr:Stage sporulation family protein [Verrucomicrobiaceae bacterium]